MSFTADQIRVGGNLYAIGKKWRPRIQVPELLFLAIPKQECNWDDQAVGDNGDSFGPFQIDVLYHPQVTRYFSTDPEWDYGFPEIWMRWRDKWAPYAPYWVGATAEQRAGMLFQAAPQMQGSIPWTPAQAVQNYADAVAMLEVLS